MLRRILLVTLVLAVCRSAAATTYVVTPDGTGDFATIQAAINAASAGDVIELTEGVFTGTGNRDLDLLGKAITICSQNGDPAACTLDCEGGPGVPHRGFWFHSSEGPEARVQDITVTGAYTCDMTPSELGGAMLIEGSSSPQIAGCVFLLNHAATGGAVHCGDHAHPHFEDCVFEQNTAGCIPGGGAGGALSSAGQAAVHLSGCFFDFNASMRAGAIAATSGGNILIENTTFVRNGPVLYGGTLVLEGGTSLMRGCTFHANRLEIEGAQMHCSDGHGAILENTIIAFSENCAAIGVSGGADVSLSCCDLYGNADGDWVGPIAGQLGINGNICADPWFCDAPDDDLRLHADSPCAPFTPPNEECDLIGAWPVGCASMGLRGAEGGGVILISCQPNPFFTATTIHCAVPAGHRAPVCLKVCDPTGRVVRTLAAGRYRASWDGRDDAGRELPGGIYFIRLGIGARVASRTVTLIR